MASNDWLGGYSMEELLGSAPVIKDEKKPSVLGKILGAPFKLVFAVVKLPVTAVSSVIAGIATLPVRLVRAVMSPLRKKQ